MLEPEGRSVGAYGRWVIGGKNNRTDEARAADDQADTSLEFGLR